MTDETEIYQHTAYYGWGVKLLALMMMGGGLFMAYVITYECINAIANGCANTCLAMDDRWMAALLIGFPIAFGACWLWGCINFSIKWNSKFIEYRALTGQKMRAELSSIVDVGRVVLSGIPYVEFDTYPKMFFSPDIQGSEALVEELEARFIKKFPHRFYMPAYREMLDVSDEAGCVSCEALLRPDQIVSWKPFKKQKKQKGAGEGRAICPMCKSDDSVICNLSIAPITLEAIRKINSGTEPNREDVLMVLKQHLKLTSTA